MVLFGGYYCNVYDEKMTVGKYLYVYLFVDT